MKTALSFVKTILMAAALALVITSVIPVQTATAVNCKEDAGDECELSSGDILEDWDERDEELF